ncbi:MAG: adenosylcobinamide-phosphate synthase CbiB [Thermotogota bacterium]|nr:adenosylcobinamide-phosphate synthase CbiB [Thermotogota bacterium]
MTFLIAIIVDLIFGEPHSRVHPVVGIGKLISFLDKRLPRSIVAGGVCVLIIIVLGGCLAYGVGKTGLLLVWFSPFLLTSSFSISSLFSHVQRCHTKDIDVLRRSVSTLVSRDTAELSKEELYSAAVESLAENYVDSILSPFFYFILFGLPGAFIYRCANTMDAMIGYRNERYEMFGKIAARLDDVLNFIPARICVVIFMILSPKKVYSTAAKFGGIKINGTWSIASMAGLLGIRLKKEGVYDINPQRSFPTAETVARALKALTVITMITIGLSFLLLFVIDQNFFSSFVYGGLISF